MVRIGIIGYGYWGPNIARNFQNVEGAQLVAICDSNPVALSRAKTHYPGIHLTSSASELLTSKDIDAVAVITPVGSHYELTKAALHEGKHVFVEKPFTCNAEQGEELVELGRQNERIIMVDHTFLFTGAVRKIRQLIDDGSLGKLYYYDSTRVNLGLFQHDVNVIWDLAPHDLSIMDYLIDSPPEAVVATGEAHLNGLEDLAFITVYFPNNTIAHINVNWLSPVKVRTTLIGGQKKMLVWNDLEADEKLRVYDKGVHVRNREGLYELLVSYRTGDMWAPKLEQVEALKVEVAYFLDCIAKKKQPFNGGAAGVRIVKMLHAAHQSLKQKGKAVYIEKDSFGPHELISKELAATEVSV
jgi:predicted dehydrogenase